MLKSSKQVPPAQAQSTIREADFCDSPIRNPKTKRDKEVELVIKIDLSERVERKFDKKITH